MKKQPASTPELIIEIINLITAEYEKKKLNDKMLLEMIKRLKEQSKK